MFKVTYLLNFHKEKTINEIVGIVSRKKPENYPFRIYILDSFRPNRVESGVYEHNLSLKVVNNFKKVVYSLKDIIPDGGEKSLSTLICRDLYAQLEDMLKNYNGLLGENKYNLSINDKNNIIIDLKHKS